MFFDFVITKEEFYHFIGHLVVPKGRRNNHDCIISNYSEGLVGHCPKQGAVGAPDYRLGQRSKQAKYIESTSNYY